MSTIKRISLVAVGVLGFATVSVAAWNSVDPDNPVANSIQIEQAKKVPGELWRITPASAINGRMVVVLVHGWTSKGWLTRTEVEQTFESMLINWRGVEMGTGIFAEDFGVRTDDHFVIVEYRYDTTIAADENGRRLWKKIEGEAELTGREIQLVLIGHSMGGLVSQGYRVVEDHKLAGLLGAGVPINGSPANDLVKVTTWANQIAGKGGPQLLAYVVQDIDFTTDGIRWLSPNFGPRKTMFESEPLDANCYLYAGSIKSATLKPAAVVLRIAMLADAAKLQGDGYQQAMIAYPFAASMIEGCGGGANDGMVPVSSAMGVGVAGKAILRDMGDYNHSQIIRGSGDYQLHRQMAHDLWEIYQRTSKQDPKFGEYELVLPSLDLVGGLDGFAPKLDKPISVWWQSDSGLCTLSATGELHRLNIDVGLKREVAVDDSGWKVAVPSDNGLIVFDLKAGKRFSVLRNNRVTAVGWESDRLLAVYDHKLCMLNDSLQLLRVVVDDPALNSMVRIVAVNQTIYLTSGLGGIMDIYEVPSDGHNLRLTSRGVRVIRNAKCRPRTANSWVVGVYQENGRSKIRWFSAGLIAPSQVPGKSVMDKLITEDVLGAVTDVAVTSDSQVYLIIDGQIRRLDMELANRYALAGLQKMIEARERRESEAVMSINLDVLAPVVGQGTALGAR